MEKLTSALKRSHRAVAFTGAGVSTLCGIPDFRGPDGLYSRPGVAQMFEIDIFYENPELYYQNARTWIYEMGEVTPGPVHLALAELERRGIIRGIITQNIDMLHQRAGSRVVAEVHGSPQLHHCIGCGSSKTFAEICQMLTSNNVPRCQLCGGAYKPDITFFGESLPRKAFELAEELTRQADLMLVLGSSLTVYPAASLPEIAAQRGVPLYIVNAQPTPLDAMAAGYYTDLKTFAAQWQ